MATITITLDGVDYPVPGQGAQASQAWGDQLQAAVVALANAINAVPGGTVTNPLTGNFTIVQPVNTEAGFYVSAPGDQGGITDGLWSYGRPSVAGVGLQTIRTLYSDNSTAEHIVSSLESQGTLGIVGNGDLRARYESYNLDGEQNPHFRTNTFGGAGITIECGRNGCVVPVGGLTRSGSTVTAHAPGGHVFEVGDYISLTCNDANYPQGLETYQVASVADSTHFTYSSSGTTVASTAQGIFTTPVDCKLRVQGRQHWAIVLGDHAHEFVVLDVFADSLVTAAGVGMSYGGSVIYQPQFLTGAYSLQAGSAFMCDATAGAWAFTLPARGNYFSKPGRTITVTKTDSSGNAVTLTAPSNVTIGGSSTKALSAQYKSATLQCDGLGTSSGGTSNDTWYVIGSN